MITFRGEENGTAFQVCTLPDLFDIQITRPDGVTIFRSVPRGPEDTLQSAVAILQEHGLLLDGKIGEKR